MLLGKTFIDFLPIGAMIQLVSVVIDYHKPLMMLRSKVQCILFAALFCLVYRRARKMKEINDEGDLYTATL